jgi:hypothetical protein
MAIRMTKHMRPNHKRSLFAILPPMLLAVFHLAASQQGPNDADAAQRMARATKRQQYDKAVQIGLDALKGKPSDGFLLSQVGLVYLQRAIADGQQRETWLDQATDYASKSAKAAPPDKLNTFNAARVYESAGDLSTGKKCSYYERSKELFDGLALDSRTTADSHGRDSVVLAKRGLEGKNRVIQKSKAANCAEPGPASR